MLCPFAFYDVGGRGTAVYDPPSRGCSPQLIQQCLLGRGTSNKEIKSSRQLSSKEPQAVHYYTGGQDECPAGRIANSSNDCAVCIIHTKKRLHNMTILAEGTSLRLYTIHVYISIRFFVDVHPVRDCFFSCGRNPGPKKCWCRGENGANGDITFEGDDDMCDENCWGDFEQTCGSFLHISAYGYAVASVVGESKKNKNSSAAYLLRRPELTAFAL